jgi:hypothetical protein
VWRVACRFASLGGRKPAISRGALYALFDGLFQRCLLRHLSGDRRAIADLLEEVERLLPTVACGRRAIQTNALTHPRLRKWLVAN